MSKQKLPFIAAIGAGVGSGPAVERFLSALGMPTDLAILIVANDEETASAISAMNGTATVMKVKEPQGGERVVGGSVFAVNSGQIPIIKDGRIEISSGLRSKRSAIDACFRSVAKTAGARAAGLIFSGEGTDGYLGLEDLARAGALTLAQDPDMAPSRSMPEAATGMAGVDFTGPPERLAEEVLLHLARSVDLDAGGDGMSIELHNVREICEVLKEASGHDFQHYKSSTLARRIMRRIQITKLRSADDYLLFLKDNPDEASALTRDLLIGVTAFFRDPVAFEALAVTALTPLLKAGSGSLRMWVAGCGTGQEAYTLAMIATELSEKLDVKLDMQIFATDLDERALNTARRGIYMADAMRDVNPARQERFFDRSGRRFQVTKELRRLVVFSPHNLISDPPFSRLDLISCRNVLIYLGSHLQKKLISVFHYALKDNGFLFLGSSESIAGHGDLFRVVDSKHRIAQRKSTGAKMAGQAQNTGQSAFLASLQSTPVAETDLGAVAQRILLDEFAPPYAVVNEDGQLVYLSQKAETFLQPPEGAFVNNILRMVRSGLRVGLRSAWSEAKETKRKAIYEGLLVEMEGQSHQIRLTVQPMPELGNANGLYMIVFQPAGSVGAHSVSALPMNQSEKLVEKLELELLRTRDELERAVQDLEAANEELKSSNEELLSMNEELQSSNEELESSKQEVEAGNQALAAANADLQNLLQSTEIATVFLDADHNIRGFTPAASSLINFVPADVGRPIGHLTHRFTALALPSLSDVENARSNIETEATTLDGKTFLQRVTVYRNAEGAPDGIVLTFIDITEQKHTQQRLMIAEEQAATRLAELESIYASAPVGLALIDRDFRYVRVNEALARMKGVPAADHVGRFMHELVPDLSRKLEPIFRKVLAAGETQGPFELVGETPNLPGMPRVWLETWAPVRDAGGAISGVSLSSLDITDRKRANEAVAASEARLRRLLDNLFAFVGVLRADGVLVEANLAPIQVAGLMREDVIGKPFWDCYWWNYSDESKDRLRDAFRRCLAGETVRYDAEIRVAGGRFITIDFQLAPLKDEMGHVTEIIPSGIDISERLRAERQRELLLEELNHRVKNTLAVIQGIATLSLRSAKTPKDFAESFTGRLQAIGRAHDTVTGKVLSDLLLPTLIFQQIRPYAAGNSKMLCLDGPDVRLTPEATHSLGLIFHELATNAMKYGALSKQEGTLNISWQVEEPGPRLRIRWVEKGGPSVTPPSKKGFGSRLIEQITNSLSGSIDIQYLPEGLVAEIEFPLP